MRILVTGGAGFIGANLCEYLLEEDHEVICLDNFYTGRRENIKPFLKNKNFSLVKHDVIKPISLKVDLIYHLACPASPPHYQKDPIFTIKTSFLGTLNMLKLAEKNNARILFASTSEIYGNPRKHPQKEDYFGNVNPVGVRSCYDEGKRAAETLCADFLRKKNVDVKIVRIFNTYGPKMDPKDGRVVSNFIVQALEGDDLTVYGDGTQTRSFQYISDLISGMVKMMEMEKGFLGPINLGNPDEFTVKELAYKVLQLTDSKSKISYLPLPEDDPVKRCPDITLAMRKLGWKPKVGLKDGLMETASYFRSICQ